jgi:uncharacterized protein (DUF2384 family)
MIIPMEHTAQQPSVTAERIPRADSFNDVDDMRLYIHGLLHDIYQNDDIVMMWLGAPNANLDNQVPLAVMNTDPDRVIRLVVAFNKTGIR